MFTVVATQCKYIILVASVHAWAETTRTGAGFATLEKFGDAPAVSIQEPLMRTLPECGPDLVETAQVETAAGQHPATRSTSCVS